MELPGRDVCYRALESRDARFDGLIFVGISSTGIYCRPICPARTPRLANCHFFPSAAAAQEAGFRPCLRCRPEIAPDLATWRGTSSTVSRALVLIAEGALDGPHNSVEALATRLGLGERQLRRLFLQHLGASPVSVAQTRRVLFAKQLLHDTDMPIAEVARAAGFSSLRRFNETFLTLFKRPPRALRKRAPTSATKDDARDILLRLRYRAPYDWESMLAFLRGRAIPGVELVEGSRFFRTVELNGLTGSISVAHLPKQQSLAVSIRFPDVRALPAIVASVRRLFDLGADIATIAAHLSTDPALTSLISARPGLRAPGGWDGFETAVRAVLNQQISIAAARTFASRLAEQHGRAVPRSLRLHPSLSRTFPTAKRLASTSSIGLTIPATRLATLRALAEAALADPNLFRALGDIDETVGRLQTIRGIGSWSAHYIALRAVREMDAFPATDLVLLRSASIVSKTKLTASSLLALSQRWRPWRAYAAQHLWAASRELTALHTPLPETHNEKEPSMSLANKPLAYKIIDSPVGALKLVASDKGLVAILWPTEKPNRVRLGSLTEVPNHPILLEAERQLHEYFAGSRTSFSLPFDMRGTSFQQSVWQALLAIPFGETRSYAQLAQGLGNPNATRAVGAANGRNPLSIVVPCHRVIGASGSLTGFAGGLETKAHLLNLEQQYAQLSARTLFDPPNRLKSIA